MEKNLGRNIVIFRKKLNMTQAELAEKMCVTYQTISNWERGISFPDVDSIGKLCEVLCVGADELFGFKAQQTVQNLNNIRKNKPAVVYYSEKVKSSKLLTAFMITMIVSFLLFELLSNDFILGTFGLILYFISIPVFLLSFICTIIFLFVAKIYSKNKIFIYLYIAFLIGFIVFMLLGIKSYTGFLNENLVGSEGLNELKNILENNKTGNILMIISNICYYFSNVLIYFVFKDKSKEELNFKFIIAYYACVIVDILFVFVFKYPLDFIFIILLSLLVCIKKDKTVEIPYYTDSEIIKDIENEKILKSRYAQELMPSSSSGIVDKNRYLEVVEPDYQPIKLKINVFDVFSGGKLTAILACLIGICVIISVSTGLFSVSEIIILLGVLPLLFYGLLFTFKKGGKYRILDLLFLILQTASLIIQNLIFMENLTFSFLSKPYFLVSIILEVVCVSYMVLFYKRNCEVSLWRKLLIISINILLSSLFVIVAFGNEDIKLGMLFIVLIVNMLTSFVSSFAFEDKFE